MQSQQQYQRRLELVALAYVFSALMLAGTTFITSPSERVFRVFSEDFGVQLTGNLFAVLCFAGAVAVWLLLHPRVQALDAVWRRTIYVLAAFPLPLYTVPAGWYALRLGSSGLAPLTFMLVFSSFAIIAGAVYRE